MRMQLRVCVVFLASYFAVPVSAAEAGPLEQPGMLISCFFQQPDSSKSGVGIFIPSTGVKDKAILPEQIRNPDGLLSPAGFDHVKIETDSTAFTGKNEMTLMFMGGEVYRANLRGEGRPAQEGTCVVAADSGATNALENFDGFRRDLNQQGMSEGSKQ